MANIDEQKMQTCAICSNEFEKRRNSKSDDKFKTTYKLRIKQKITLLQAYKELQGTELPNDRHVCRSCLVSVEQAYRQFIACTVEVLDSSTPTATDTPTRKRSKSSPSNKGNPKCAKAAKANRFDLSESVSVCVVKSEYHAAFRKLLTSGKAARRAFKDIVRSQVKAEFAAYMAMDSQQLSQLNGVRSVEDFSWTTLVEELKAKLPVFSAAVIGAMPGKIHDDQTRRMIKSRVGMMMTVPLYTRKPCKFRFVQSLNGMQMLRYGASRKLFRSFNSLGICQGIIATRRSVNMCVNEADMTVERWKKKVKCWNDKCVQD